MSQGHLTLVTLSDLGAVLSEFSVVLSLSTSHAYNDLQL